MFSCTIDPAVTGGGLEALRLGRGPDGDARRQRIGEDAERLRSRLAGKVDRVLRQSWSVTVLFGADALALPLFHFLPRCGLEGSILMSAPVNRNEGRIGLFVTAEQTAARLDRAAEIVLAAGRRFGFLLDGAAREARRAPTGPPIDPEHSSEQPSSTAEERT